jgi:integrase
LDTGSIHRAFYAASRRVGLRGASDSHGPRLHDLRHRFATTTLVNWYRSNEDPERRLPLLSAFLGHNLCLFHTVTIWVMSPKWLSIFQRNLAAISPSDAAGMV